MSDLQDKILTVTQEAVLATLRRRKGEGAFWTSDIAQMSRMHTSQARLALKILEGMGKARRVVSGNPSSWELVGE